MQSISWRRNLYLIAFSEFLALVGFSLFNPFMPLYIQELGKLSREQAAVWAGIATGGAGLAMFVSSPIWGIIADRVGRKPMLLRALFGGTIVVALYIVAPNIQLLVLLRVMQGLFTGTITAASALIAGMTPRDKLPYSMGVLMGGAYAGMTCGPLVGGFLADNLGFSATFGITTSLLFIAGLVILTQVREEFVRPVGSSVSPFRSMLGLVFSREVFPLLLVVSVLSLGPQILSPVLPLVIGEVSHSSAATVAGMAIALMGLVTTISSLIFGRLNGRFPVRHILVLCCVGTGLLYLPPIWAQTEVQIVFLIALAGTLTGGIVTSSNSLVSMAVPVAQQGLAYGLSQSASSLGGGVGPFIGGGLAPLIGLRYTFAVAAGVYVLVGILALRLIPERAIVKQPAKAE